MYAIVASSLCLGFIFVTPPFQSPDEQLHYERIQYIVHGGHILPVDHQHHPEIALPKSISNVADTTHRQHTIDGDVSKKYDINRTKEALRQPFITGETYRPAMIPYSPVPYLPALPGVFVVNKLGKSPLIGLYVTRLSLALAAIVMITLAIKIIPTKKYLLAALCLLPMVLFQQSTASADGLSVAILVLLIAYVFRLYEVRKIITKRQWSILLVLVGLLSLSKTLLYLFIPLIMILWKKPGAKQWIIASCGLAACLVLVWTGLTRGLVVDSNMNEQVNSKKQLINILHHPYRLVEVTANTYGTPYGDNTVRGTIGTLGVVDVQLPIWMQYGYVFCVAILWLVDQKGRKKFPRWSMFVVGGLTLMYIALVHIAMYLVYSPVNFAIFYGVQGRYLVPAILMILMASGCSLRAWKNDGQKMVYKLMVAVIIMGALSLLITFSRYYIVMS